ncbi:MAG: pitrilysin family protein [Pseudomonadota bacterium]
MTTSNQTVLFGLTAGVCLFLAGCAEKAPDSATDSPSGRAAANEQGISSSAAQDADGTEGSAALSIPFEKFTLDNGLDVVLHVDKSDPVVAIDLAVHVGSAREVTGRTGFAHLFEHLLFLDSENLGYGGLDEMNTRIGGEGTNGFTTEDMTQYFQAVPADALEKVIWAEADKLGWFINTVTQPVIDNEKQVVKNEKRQRVDNQPYGHNFYVIRKALYPEDHPYNWQVIGSLEDLDAATLQDVKDFYARWYVPNNVTVTIAGDFDPASAKALVTKYFGDIPRGEPVEDQAKRPGKLDSTISLFHEDAFATVPQLTMVWPGVERFHPDAYALDILMDYLSNGKRAPFNEVLIDEAQVTSNVDMVSVNYELAGEIYLFVRSTGDGDLDGLVSPIETAFSRFEENGISEEDLARIKAGLEVGVYNNLQSVLGKAIELGEYNLFTDDPGYITKDVQSLLAVTAEDVRRVYDTYIKGKAHIATSFVPRDKPALALDGARRATVIEEPIVAGAEAQTDFDPRARTFEPTFSSFDRSQEPAFGGSITLRSPDIWRGKIGETISVYGIENAETPLVYFSLALEAGRDRGTADKPAVANLTADLLEKGTQTKTTAELEDAIKMLGSSISFSAGPNGSYISGQTLARNLDATIALMTEMVLEPRWDTEEFDLLKRRTLDAVKQAEANPGAIARREEAALYYPEDHVFRYQAYGTAEKLEAVTLDDLKAFYAAHYSPVGAALRIVGDVTPAQTAAAFAALGDGWTGNTPAEVALAQPEPVTASKIYFYDVPDAKQSILRISRPALDGLAPTLPQARAMNFLLGDIYTSRLNTELRVNRGYTYGIGSGFGVGKDRGFFRISSSVRSNVTAESIDLIRNIVSGYGPSFTEDDLGIMKGALARGEALKTESLNAKLSILGDISTFGYADDYRVQNIDMIKAMTLDDFKAVAATHLKTDQMNWLVVGDAKTQLGLLGDLGFGQPILINKADE